MPSRHCCSRHRSTRTLFHWIWTRRALMFIASENVFGRCSSCVCTVPYWFDPLIRIQVTLSPGTSYLPLPQWNHCYEQLCLPTLTCNDYYVLNQSTTNYSHARSAELPGDLGSEQDSHHLGFIGLDPVIGCVGIFNFIHIWAPFCLQSFVFLVFNAGFSLVLLGFLAFLYFEYHLIPPKSPNILVSFILLHCESLLSSSVWLAADGYQV